MAAFKSLCRRRRLKAVTLCVFLSLVSMWIYNHVDWEGMIIVSGSLYGSQRNRLLKLSQQVDESSSLYVHSTHKATPTTAPLQSTYELPNLIFGGDNAAGCADNVTLLVYIQSEWSNFLRRRRLRHTWATKGVFRDIPIVIKFIVGKPPTVSDQVRINNEHILFGDIVEGNFTDSYRNLTLKSVIAMDWMAKHCPSAKYVMKADDDMFVNIFKVVEIVLPLLKPDRNVIACHVVNDGTSPIVRDKASKWYVPDQIFPNMTHFPKFCSGYAVVMTARLLTELYRISKTTDLIYVDDVYMFGLLLGKVDWVSFVDIRENCSLNEQQGLTNYNTGGHDLYVVNTVNPGSMVTLWSATLLNLSPWAREHSQV